MPVWAIINNEEAKILCVQRSQNTSHPGQWGLPGGGIKTGESPQQACLRALNEETGLDQILLESKLTYQQEHIFYLGRLKDPQQPIRLQANECTDYAWVNANELASLGKLMDKKMLMLILLKIGFLNQEDP